MSYKEGGTNMKTVLTIMIMLMLVVVMPLATAASVEPEPIDPWDPSGGAESECLLAGGCGDFAYKIEPWGMDMDDTYDNGNITISNSNNYTFDWTSKNPVCRVIVKAGTGANVYYYGFEYPDGAYGDTELVAYDGKEISHVTFCYSSNDGEITEIPEFPTVALPIAAILGLAFFFQRRKE
jgi:hypothetical protein